MKGDWLFILYCGSIIACGISLYALFTLNVSSHNNLSNIQVSAINQLLAENICYEKNIEFARAVANFNDTHGIVTCWQTTNSVNGTEFVFQRIGNPPLICRYDCEVLS